MRSLPEAGEGALQRLVRLAQDHLDMGVVCVSEFTRGRQVYRAVAGDAASFGITLGDGPVLAETYCALMIEGDIPNVVRDAAADARVSALGTTASAGIGAYVGIPLYLPDGELYGSLCGLSHHVEDDLNVRDVKFLSLLAEFIADELATERSLSQQHEALEQVIEARDVRIALQPVVDLLSGRCTSMEALARFSPPWGAPDVVFAQAEEVGLRQDLEKLAVVRAVELLPVLAPHQSLAVNLSPETAMTLIPRVTDDRPLNRLILEMTEHAAVENYVALRENLAPLRDRGLRLAIDDAGSGFASLRHIVELQPDIIKIDRALIAGIGSDAARRSVVTTFVLLALDIGATVVAEGVETREELVVAATLGVDAAQGYLLARPSTNPSDIARWAHGGSLLTDALHVPPAGSRTFVGLVHDRGRPTAMICERCGKAAFFDEALPYVNQTASFATGHSCPAVADARQPASDRGPHVERNGK